MAKFKFYVSTGYVGSDQTEECEIDDAELEGKTEEEVYKIVGEHFNDWLFSGVIETGWSRID